MTDTEHSTSASSVEPGPAAVEARPDPATAGAPEAAGGSAAAAGPTPRLRRFVSITVLLLVALAIILGAALYYQHQQYQALRADLLRQHQESTQEARETQSQAAQALTLARQQAAQIAELRSALDNTSSQVQDLDQAMQTVTDSGSDAMLLNDIDRLVTIAQQQLGLGGNVANAIVSLEAAQAQLARANRSNLAALQQSINGDLDRLRAVVAINVPALSARLDQLSDLVASAPLLVPDGAAQPAVAAPGPVSAAASAPSGAVQAGDWRASVNEAWGWTRATADSLAHDFRGLFDIRRVDDTAALLMSPDQALRFREGLKQRVVTAQLALMMHQPKIWQAELAQVARSIDGRFDMRAESSREALKLARDLHDTPVEVRLPTVDNSLDAVAAARDAAAAQESDGGGDSGANDGGAAPASQSPVSAGQGKV